MDFARGRWSAGRRTRRSLERGRTTPFSACLKRSRGSVVRRRPAPAQDRSQNPTDKRHSSGDRLFSSFRRLELGWRDWRLRSPGSVVGWRGGCARCMGRCLGFIGRDWVWEECYRGRRDLCICVYVLRDLSERICHFDHRVNRLANMLGS
jgi:hypothetical protein